MNRKAEIMIANSNNEFHVRVYGHATFNTSSALLTAVKNLVPEKMKAISIDLRDCTGMDSTFMGIIAKLALNANRVKIVPEILNASESNQELLSGLGIKKLFSFKSSDSSMMEPENMISSPQSQISDIETAKTVLDAHEELMKADQGNVEKFSNVVQMVKEDIARLQETPPKKPE